MSLNKDKILSTSQHYFKKFSYFYLQIKIYNFFFSTGTENTKMNLVRKLLVTFLLLTAIINIEAAYKKPPFNGSIFGKRSNTFGGITQK